MNVVFFAAPTAFRKWLKKHHAHQQEILVGFHKVHTGKPSMTWSQSVDEALCYGWIDGVRKSIDADSYSIRFTPRRPGSTWSAINIKKVEELTKKGLMQPAGVVAFSSRIKDRSKIYSYEKVPAALDMASEKKFKFKKKAWDFFKSQPPSYQRTVIHWIVDARRNETREIRLQKLIEACANQKKL